MSRIFATAGFIGVLLMSTATLRGGPAKESLRVGDLLPTLKGQFLTGRDAVLPQASSGKVALVAMGFTYQHKLLAMSFRRMFNARSLTKKSELSSSFFDTAVWLSRATPIFAAGPSFCQ